MNAENSATHKGSLHPSTGRRNPLADLPQNDNALRLRRISRSTTTAKTLKPSKDGRSSSATEVETNVKYAFKSETVTERQKNNQVISDFDEVFIEGEEHFVKYLPEKKEPTCVQDKVRSQEVETNIPKPLPVIRVSGTIQAQLQKPAKKLTLVRKLSSRSKRSRNEDIFKNYLYDSEYSEDNYRYMLAREKHFVYRKSYLLKYVDQNYRMLVINWLTYVQQLLDLSESTFFAAIRMFDYLLISSKISCSKYNLAGIVCLWIANKNFDVHYIQVPKIFAVCGSKFSKQQILSTEKEVLRALKFNINFPEPETFLYYYLKNENLENNEKIRNSAMFLLEAFTLLIDFSSLTPSLLASVALYLVLNKYDVKDTSLLSHVEQHILDVDTFKHKSDQLNLCLKQLLQCKCVSNEFVAKYSNEDKCKVAQYFTVE